MAEIVEEYTQVTKKVIHYMIIVKKTFSIFKFKPNKLLFHTCQTICVLHILGWLFEDLPKSCILPGLLAHICYHVNTFEFYFILKNDVKFQKRL